jgi:Skp family chaperone for outer membrane proteins
MKFLAHKALIASFALAAPMMIAGQAHAQARSIGVADLEAAVTKSNAYVTAMTQMQTTYKPQIDQINARTTALNTELQPLVNAFNAARGAPGATNQSVQPSYTALQTRQQAAEQEIARLSQPVQLARAYVVEQIGVQVDAAVRAAMRARSVDLVVSPAATVSYQPAADITAVVTTEINRLVPSVQIVPPAGWQPGQRQQAAPAATQPQPPGR